MVTAEERAVHSVLVPQLPQIPAFVALPVNDAGSGFAGAGGVGLRNPALAQAGSGFRSCAVVLLPAAPAAHSRSGCAGLVFALRPGDVVVRQSGRPRRAPIRLRLQSADCLSCLARRAAGALSRLPLVRGCQTAPARTVVELSVEI